MKKLLSILLLISLLIGVFTGCGPEQIDDEGDGIKYNSEKKYIVQNNATDYAIVVAKDATEPIEYAASELAFFVKESTGVELPIITDEEVTTNVEECKIISIGKNKMLSRAPIDVDYDAISIEGFFTKTYANSVYIDSNSETGVFYGVYDLLEKYLGAVFFVDSTYYIDKVDEFFVYDMDIEESPAYEYREYCTKIDTPLSIIRQRYHRGSGYLDKLGKNVTVTDFWNINEAHTFYHIVSYAEYGASNPEYFLPDATNWDLTNGLTDDGDVDYDYEDRVGKKSLFDMALENLKEIILANPNVKYFMVGQPDNARGNNTTRGKLFKEKFGGGESGILMVFINNLSKEIEKWLNEMKSEREVYIVTFAYQGTADAPATLDEKGNFVPTSDKVKAHKNVCIRLALECCNYHAIMDETCQINTRFQNAVNGWSAICDKFFVYTYSCNFRDYLVYFPHVRTMRDNFIMYDEMGVKHMYNNVIFEENIYKVRLQAFMYSKLMWKPDQDVNSLFVKFNKAWFGDVGDDYVNSYVNFMESHLAYLDNTYPGGFKTDLYEKFDYCATTNWPYESLIYAIDTIQSGIDAVNANSDYSDEEKARYVKRLYEVIVTPMEMIKRNLSSYISGAAERDAFMVRYKECIQKAGVTLIANGVPIEQ